jgi:hypothetical protein
MSLRDLKTDLKSLKYGNDRPGGGNSGQPYQKVDINTVDSGFNRLRMIKFDDGLIRGGAIGALNSAVVDTLRIGKFLVDFPKGPLWIAKQVGLQLSNPQLEAKKLRTDNPTSGGGLLRNVGNVIANTVNKIVNAVGPTRIYNLGINTIAQVPVGAFGIHFNRHGLLPIQDDNTKYLKVVEHNNEGKGSPNNRLVGYKNKFKLGDFKIDQNKNVNIPGAGTRVINVLNSLGVKTPPLNTNSIENTINKYISGPGSVYGIGNTLIQRYSFTENGDKVTKAFENSKNVAGKSYLTLKPIEINSNANLYPISSKYTGSIFISPSQFDEKLNTDTNLRTTLNNFIASNSDKNKSTTENKLKLANKSADQGLSKLAEGIPGDISQANESLPETPRNIIKYSPGIGNTAKYKELRELIDYRQQRQQLYTVTNISGIRPNIKSDETKLTTITPVDKYGLPSPARVEISPSGSSDGSTSIIRAERTNQSKVQPFSNYNLSSDSTKQVITVNVSRGDRDFKYVSEGLKNQFKRTNDINVDEDQLALVFTPLDPFTGKSLNTLKFLGYLTNYTENYNSTWDPIKYAGRAESFYIFKEFKRDLNIGFDIPCFNPTELREKHCALSELASTLAGKYNESNLLGGIITKLKVGNYVNNQPGIITSLTFNPIEGSSWDLDQGLAFYLKVTIGFTLIHNFLPQYYKCGFIDKQPDPDPQPTKKRSDPTPTPTPTPTARTGGTGTAPVPTISVPVVERQRAVADSTRVRPPYQTDRTYPQLRDYGGGSQGGAGTGGRWDYNDPSLNKPPTNRPGGPGPGG